MKPFNIFIICFSLAILIASNGNAQGCNKKKIFIKDQVSGLNIWETLNSRGLDDQIEELRTSLPGNLNNELNIDHPCPIDFVLVFHKVRRTLRLGPIKSFDLSIYKYNQKVDSRPFYRRGFKVFNRTILYKNKGDFIEWLVTAIHILDKVGSNYISLDHLEGLLEIIYEKKDQEYFLKPCKRKKHKDIFSLISLNTNTTSNDALNHLFHQACTIPALNESLLRFSSSFPDDEKYTPFAKILKFNRIESYGISCVRDDEIAIFEAIHSVYKLLTQPKLRERFYLKDGVSEHLDSVKHLLSAYKRRKQNTGPYEPLLEQLANLDYYHIDTAPSKALKSLIDTLRLSINDPRKLCLPR